MIVAPAGSGKTIIAAQAVARRAWSGCRVTWLANTKEQVEQGIVAIEKTGGPEGVEFEVCCVASEPDCSKTDILVVDECHHAPAESWSRTIGVALESGAVVWGFTATPWNNPERDAMVTAAFVEFHKIERQRVEDSGHLAPGKVYMHDLDTPGQFDGEIDRLVAAEMIRRSRRFPMIQRFEHERRARWQITQEYIQANENRNSAIVSLCTSEAAAGASVLCLVFSIEHGEKLAARIPGALLCHSKLPARARRERIQGFRDGTIPVLTSTSLADEGLDVPRASRLVLASGGRSAGKLEQRAGRVLRPFEGKVVGTVHDFLDQGACFALAQARARFRVYERLGYSPEMVSYGQKTV